MKLSITKFFSAYILMAPLFHVASADTSFADASDNERNLELASVPAPEPVPDPIQDSSTQPQDQGVQPQSEADNQQTVPTSDPTSVPSSTSEPAPEPAQDLATQPQDQENPPQTKADNQQTVPTSDPTSVPSSTSEPAPDPVQEPLAQPQDQGDQPTIDANNQQSVLTSDPTSVPSSTSEPVPDQVQEPSTQPQDQGNQAKIQQNQELPSQEKTKLAIEPDKQQSEADQQKMDEVRDKPSENQTKDDMRQTSSTSQMAADSKVSTMEDQEAFQARALEEVKHRKQVQTEAAKQKLSVAKHKKIEVQRLGQEAMARQEIERKLANENGQFNKDKAALGNISKDPKSQDVHESKNSASNNEQKQEPGQVTSGASEDRDLEQEIARNEEKLAMLRSKLKSRQGHVKMADDPNSSHKDMHALSSLDEHGNIVQNEDRESSTDEDKNLTKKSAGQNAKAQSTGKHQKHKDDNGKPKTQ